MRSQDPKLRAQDPKLPPDGVCGGVGRSLGRGCEDKTPVCEPHDTVARRLPCLVFENARPRCRDAHCKLFLIEGRIAICGAVLLPVAGLLAARADVVRRRLGGPRDYPHVALLLPDLLTLPLLPVNFEYDSVNFADDSVRYGQSEGGALPFPVSVLLLLHLAQQLLLVVHARRLKQ